MGTLKIYHFFENNFKGKRDTMINKRLMNLLKDSKKYVAQMVIWNWIALLCNVVFIFSFAYLLENLLNNSINTNMVIIAVVIDLLVVIIRSFCYKKSSNASFYAAADVKKTLRENIYNKLLSLGSSYEDKIPTAEIVQVSGEGVEQLEIYFGKYLAQLFYSLAAPVTLFIILAFIMCYQVLLISSIYCNVQNKKWLYFIIAIATLLFFPLAAILGTVFTFKNTYKTLVNNIENYNN